MDAQLVALVGGSSVVAFGCAFVCLGGRGRRAGPGADPFAQVAEALRDTRLVREWERREREEARREACLREMPLFLDILTLGLSAGLSFDASLELYCEGFDNGLAQAFHEAMISWRIGLTSRPQALSQLADDMGVQALSRFSSVVSEALAFGTPLSQALERQAQAIRDEQRSQVEERIEKVPVKMLIPLGTLIVPAMLLAILGPLLGSAVGLG